MDDINELKEIIAESERQRHKLRNSLKACSQERDELKQLVAYIVDCWRKEITSESKNRKQKTRCRMLLKSWSLGCRKIRPSEKNDG